VFLPGLLALYTGMAGITEGPVAQMIASEREKVAAHIEAHLSKHAYFAGATFTAADCLMGFQIVMTDAQGGLANRPATKAWLDRVTARPAYQAMLAVGV
jgi:glutathione S-transferase